MVSNSVEIGNICDLQEGYVNPSQKVPGYFGGGIRWLRAVDLNDAEVFETSRTLSQEGYESAGKSALMFPANSIGISKSGTIGRLGILRKPMCGNRAVINIVPKQSNDLRYIFYSLRMARQSIIAMAVGSVQKNLYVPVLESLTIPWPEQHVRDTIVDIAGSIDDKIAVNTRVNGYLAEICETLAAAVEADGESVLADISVQITEKEACSISSLESYVSTESLLPNKGGRQEASSLPTTGKVTVYKMGDTLVSNIRPYFKKIWLADRDGTCSGDVIVFRAKEPRHAAYLYSMLRSDSFFEHVMAGAKGTKMPRGDKKQMMQYPVARGCDKGTLDALTAMVGQIGANSRENETLSNLRDALLPKLMSGKVDVSEVELPTLPNNRFKDSVT